MIKKLRKLKETIKKVNNKPKKIKVQETNGDYIELTEKEALDRRTNLFVRYCILDEFSDVKPILDFIREGYSVCVIKIKPLKDKDINELKRAISKIKKVCDVMEGDIVGMDEDYLIATPSFVKVSKGTGLIK